MRINDIFLTEGVVVHGKELLAYTIVIAEKYKELPTYDPSAQPYWDLLVESNERLAKRVLGDLDVTYTEEDPYRNMNELLNDVIVNKRLKVYKTPGETHPGMRAVDNDLFRALHDAVAHVGGNMKQFLRFLADKKAGKRERYIPLSSNFTVRGEMNAYGIHARLAPPKARGALFTEVVGQICTYFVTGNYTINKVAIMDDVDFDRVGVLYGRAKRRFEEVLAEINDEEVSTIRTSLGNLDKSKIRWGLLSRGTGAGNIS